MATPYTLPKYLITSSYSLQELKDGIGNAVECPDVLHEALGETDLRWDQLVERAIASVLPEVVALVDAAISAEWEKAPLAIEWRRVPKAVPA